MLSRAVPRLCIYMISAMLSSMWCDVPPVHTRDIFDTELREMELREQDYLMLNKADSANCIFNRSTNESKKMAMGYYRNCSKCLKNVQISSPKSRI